MKQSARRNLFWSSKNGNIKVLLRKAVMIEEL